MKPALVKIGGSIATTAHGGDHLNRAALVRLAGELSATGAPLVVVHGTGHVGKPWAHRGGFSDTGYLPPSERRIALEIKADLSRLNAGVVRCLSDAGLPATALDFAVWKDLATVHPVAARSQLLEKIDGGETPVFHGDMLLEPDGGYRVFSSDRMMIEIARALPCGLGLFLTDVPGVFGGSPEALLPEISMATIDRAARRASDETDVSAGMRGKLENALALARLVPRCYIASGLEPGVARDLLEGRAVAATRVIGELPR